MSRTWFVPEFGGNRTRPPENRLAFEVSPMGLRSERRLVRRARFDLSTGLTAYLMSHVAAVLRTHVLQVEGLWIDAGAGLERIKDGAMLADLLPKLAEGSAHLGLFIELYEAITKPSVLAKGRNLR